MPWDWNWKNGGRWRKKGLFKMFSSLIYIQKKIKLSSLQFKQMHLIALKLIFRLYLSTDMVEFL